MFVEVLKYMRSEQGRKNIKFAIARKILNPFARKLGYTIVADHYSQPIPNDRELLIYHSKERPLSSIEWKLNHQIEFVSEILRKYCDESNDKSIISSFGYVEEKLFFMSGDAEFLYSIVRHMKPRKIVEIGAGGSTQIIASALKMNFLEYAERTGFISVEPYPQHLLKNFEGNCNVFMDFHLVEKPVQLVDLPIFESLEENDILFVDSSHVFKQGSDVEFEFLKIYPILKKGVVVHLHDIFFPFDYPIESNMKGYRFWNEQYFLEVFLQFNSKFEVLASLSMVACYDNSVFLDTINAYHETRNPGSFWMKAVRGITYANCSL